MVKKYCKFIQSGLNFHLEHIRFCNHIQVGPIISEYRDDLTAEYIADVRKKYIEDFENGKIYSACENCSFLTEEKHSSEKIDYAEIFHWTACNCGCIYCANLDLTHGKYSDEIVSGSPAVPKLLREMFDRNEIDASHLNVCFGGGDVAVLKEFPEIVDLFMQHNTQSLYIQSSGIAYSETIEKVLKNGNGFLQVGISAGSPEVYEKIKRRDKYDTVAANLKKYVENAKYKNKVVSKFIIVEGINNTTEEVEKWLQCCSDIGIEKIEFSMEFCRSFGRKSGKPVEKYNYELFAYAEKRCEELGIEFTKNYISEELMSKGYY